MSCSVTNPDIVSGVFLTYNDLERAWKQISREIHKGRHHFLSFKGSHGVVRHNDGQHHKLLHFRHGVYYSSKTQRSLILTFTCFKVLQVLNSHSWMIIHVLTVRPSSTTFLKLKISSRCSVLPCLLIFILQSMCNIYSGDHLLPVSTHQALFHNFKAGFEVLHNTHTQNSTVRSSKLREIIMRQADCQR